MTTTDSNNVNSIEICSLRESVRADGSFSGTVIVCQTHAYRSFVFRANGISRSDSYPEATIELSPVDTLPLKMLPFNPKCRRHFLINSMALYYGKSVHYRGATGIHTRQDTVEDLVQLLPYDCEEFEITFFLDANGSLYAIGDGCSLFFDVPSLTTRPIERICKDVSPIKQIATNGNRALFMLTQDSRVLVRMGLCDGFNCDYLENYPDANQDELVSNVGLASVSDITKFICPEYEKIVSIFSESNLLIASTASGYTYIVPVDARDMDTIVGESCLALNSNDGDDDDGDEEFPECGPQEEPADEDMQEDEEQEEEGQGKHALSCTCAYKVDNCFGAPLRPVKGRVVKLHEFGEYGNSIALLDNGPNQNSSLLWMLSDTSIDYNNEPIIQVIPLERNYASIAVWYSYANGNDILAVTHNLEVFLISVDTTDGHVPVVRPARFVAQVMAQPNGKSARK